MNTEEIISDCYCEELSIPNGLTFADIMNLIVTDYENRFKKRFDHYLSYYRKLSFDNALENSVLGIYESKTGQPLRWFHQQTFIKHNGMPPLTLLAEKLRRKESTIKKCQTFSTLIKLIEDNKVEKIGPLSIYDTALRLGSHLNLIPDKIYLHAGTETGYKILINYRNKEKAIDPTKFNTIPFLNNYEPKYLEDILCIYKKKFRELKNDTHQ